MLGWTPLSDAKRTVGRAVKGAVTGMGVDLDASVFVTYVGVAFGFLGSENKKWAVTGSEGIVVAGGSDKEPTFS